MSTAPVSTKKALSGIALTKSTKKAAAATLASAGEADAITAEAPKKSRPASMGLSQAEMMGVAAILGTPTDGTGVLLHVSCQEMQEGMNRDPENPMDLTSQEALDLSLDVVRVQLNYIGELEGENNSLADRNRYLGTTNDLFLDEIRRLKVQLCEVAPGEEADAPADTDDAFSFGDRLVGALGVCRLYAPDALSLVDRLAPDMARTLRCNNLVMNLLGMDAIQTAQSAPVSNSVVDGTPASVAAAATPAPVVLTETPVLAPAANSVVDAAPVVALPAVEEAAAAPAAAPAADQAAPEVVAAPEAVATPVANSVVDGTPAVIAVAAASDETANSAAPEQGPDADTMNNRTLDGPDADAPTAPEFASETAADDTNTPAPVQEYARVPAEALKAE